MRSDEVPQIMKDHFTLVAISNLSLANARFLKGCTGMTLDLLARKPFWNRNLNFNHGTGHGVGYLLNIHEGPAGFRWQFRAGEIQPFEKGMIITDEPGIYIEGSHGIRLENELLTCEGEKNEYGQFMYFEPITFIPMDLDAINPDMMTAEERKCSTIIIKTSMRKFLRIWTQKRKNGSRHTQEKSKSGQVSILGNSAPVPLGAGAVTVTTKYRR